jgi:hypothetical protein
MASELRILYLDKHTGQPVFPAWLRGYKEASAYAGLKDKRHRKLKRWMENGLQHTWDEGIPLFKPQWIDEYLMRNGQGGRHPITEQLLGED